MKNTNRLIGCCGLDCETCDARIATITNDNALREKTAALWTQLNGVTITPDMINCTGCRIEGAKTPFCDKLCPVHNCVREKGLDKMRYRMYKTFASAIAAAMLMLSLTACGTSPASDKNESSVSTDTQAESPNAAEAPANEGALADDGALSEDGAWKTEFEKSLLENYGVTPDHYEDLGDGVYQVYVEIDGRVVPYVTVDSTTGDYHG